MNYAAIESKLERMLGADLQQIERNMIMRDGQDYVVFGCYRISDNHVSKYTTDIGQFSNSRTALSWCIADKYSQHRLARDIRQLDSITASLESDVKTRGYLAKKLKDRDHKTNAEIKLQRKIQRLKLARERLDKCVNLAKYYQIRGFNNETARTGRPASYRTSR